MHSVCSGKIMRVRARAARAFRARAVCQRSVAAACAQRFKGRRGTRVPRAAAVLQTTRRAAFARALRASGNAR